MLSLVIYYVKQARRQIRKELLCVNFRINSNSKLKNEQKNVVLS